MMLQPTTNVTIISIPFTGLGNFNGFRGNDWFKRRIEIYNNYTYQSLKNQIDQNFYIWLSFRPEEKDNPLIKNIKKDYRTIMTFSGIPIWDDKKENEEIGLLERLKGSLKELNGIVNGDYVKLINLGSDDMYARDVVYNCNRQEFTPDTALTHRNGYVYQEQADMLAEWVPKTNPPFYCLMLRSKDFTEPERHFEWASKLKSHEYVVKVFNERRMEDGKYCVLTHNANISTIYNHPFRGQEIFSEETKNNILKQFGIYE